MSWSPRERMLPGLMIRWRNVAIQPADTPPRTCWAIPLKQEAIVMEKFEIACRPIRHAGGYRQPARCGASIGLAITSLLTWATAASAAEAEVDCIARISVFIREADAWLDAPPKNPETGRMSVAPLDELVGRHFPMRGCNAERFTEVVKTSKYFVDAWENPAVKDDAHKSISFSLESRSFQIHFALHKNSGHTRLSGAMVRKD